MSGIPNSQHIITVSMYLCGDRDVVHDIHNGLYLSPTHAGEGSYKRNLSIITSG